MLEAVETRGLVLFNRDFREQDMLVKILTEQAGKRMFFVKRVRSSHLLPLVQPLSVATLMTKINDSGLSYIDDYQDIKTYPKIQEDIFKLSYATYVAALADASLDDNQADPALFAFLEKTLDLMEEGLDYEVLTNIFEVQVLSRFGVGVNMHECVFCHRVGQPFDYSFRYSGVLCPQHYHEDERRSHLDPNVPYLIDRFQGIQFSELESISLSDSMKRKLRLFIDQLYDDYVGLHLKPKKFIDSLQDWGALLQKHEE